MSVQSGFSLVGTPWSNTTPIKVVLCLVMQRNNVVLIEHQDVARSPPIYVHSIATATWQGMHCYLVHVVILTHIHMHLREERVEALHPYPVGTFSFCWRRRRANLKEISSCEWDRLNLPQWIWGFKGPCTMLVGYWQQGPFGGSQVEPHIFLLAVGYHEDGQVSMGKVA